MTYPGILDFQIMRGVTFGPITLTHEDTAGAVVNLTGYTPYSSARRSICGGVEFSLSMTVTNGAGGIITIAKMTPEQTAALPCGRFFWDYVLEDSSGDRVGPIVRGQILVFDVATRD